MFTDADLEMHAFAEAAAAAVNGVCSLCEEALNPLDPKWAGSYNSPRYTAAMAAECVGPAHPDLPYHVWCLDDHR